MSLHSAQSLLERWRERGGSKPAALEVLREQTQRLRATIEDDARWDRFVEVSRRTIDPWFVTDWPETFDPLVLVVPLCHAMDWQCASCPVGVQQHGQTCANPQTPVSRLGESVAAGERRRAQSDAEVIDSMLKHAET